MWRNWRLEALQADRGVQEVAAWKDAVPWNAEEKTPEEAGSAGTPASERFGWGARSELGQLTIGPVEECFVS